MPGMRPPECLLLLVLLHSVSLCRKTAYSAITLGSPIDPLVGANVGAELHFIYVVHFTRVLVFDTCLVFCD